jgi:hypothetical protein
MLQRRFGNLKIFAFVAGSSLLAVGTAYGEASYSGTVDAVFGNAQYSGWYYDVDYNPVWIDDTLTAIYTGDGTDAITWGDDAWGTPPSGLTFTGASFTDVAPGQEFLMGELTYFNGTSTVGTSIFGGTMTVDVSLDDGTLVTPEQLTYEIVSTVNNGDPVHDADWVNFYQLDQSMHVYEDNSMTVDVYGYIAGDPQATAGYLSIAPGQENNGFLRPNAPAVPAPGAALSLLGGLIGMAQGRRRSRS